MATTSVERALSARNHGEMGDPNPLARRLRTAPNIRQPFTDPLVGVVRLALVAVFAGVAGMLAGASREVTIACSLIWLVWSTTTTGRRARSFRESGRVVKTCLAMCSALAFASVVHEISSGTAVSGMVVLGGGALGTLGVAHARRRGARPHRTVLVGGRADVEDLAVRIARETPQVVVSGVCVVKAGPAIPVQSPLPVPTVRRLDEVPALVSTVAADRVVVIPGDSLTGRDVQRLSWALERTAVSLVVVCPVSHVARHRMEVETFANTTVLDLTPPRRSTAHRAAKAGLDRIGAFLLIVAAAPLLAFLWLAVRLDSDGPGLFVQTRAGLHGRPFRMYKLRTMCNGAEALLAELSDENEQDEVLFKIREDPRVTRVGRLLRKSSLDELPQLFNVLRGDMSLVGPRPALLQEVAAYGDDTRRRLVVKPGITGLWQVSGRSNLSWAESQRLDLYYADNGRLVDDLAIAARTVSAVLQARGAY